MRIILIPILFILLPTHMYANSLDTTREDKSFCTDSLFFDGYYVILYPKSEITSLEKNRQRKAAGKSYKATFESSELKFFISRDSVSQHEFDVLIDDLTKKNKKEVYIECSKDYAKMLGEEFCIKKRNLLTCMWPEMSSGNKYFIASKKSMYCFKIYEISGWFAKLRVDTESKRDAIGKKIRYIDRRLDEFDAYFFMGYKTYCNGAPSLKEKIHFWKEVAPIF